MTTHDVAAALRTMLSERPADLTPDLGRPAGVLVPLIAGPEPLSLVFTERHADLSRHAGEISFPGGMSEPGDDDLAATALREAQEEIGVDPASVDLLGVLPPLPTFVTQIVIVPFVGLLRERPDYVPSPTEIESIIEAPVARLAEIERQVQHEHDGRIWIGHAYDVDGKVIWGATGHILKGFLDLIRKEAPWMLHAPAA
ncbi:MAG TPA: CoA pyrophosphatase [Actinomycetota bacterium]